MKIMTIVGTRPELIKLATTIQELDKYFKHILVHTGQNYDYTLSDIFFDDFEIRKPDYVLDTKAETSAQMIGNIIVKTDEIIQKEKPDAVLIYGDTNSCLAIIAAKKRKIPTFHMEAGNRSFDQRIPEELNRKIVDHCSDINMVLTEHARRYLVAEGIRPDTIFKIGSPIKELVLRYRDKINNSKIIESIGLKKNEYFVCSIHRAENIDSHDRLENIISVINEVSKRHAMPVIFSVHPHTRKQIHANKNIRINNQVKLYEPFGYFDYLTLQKNAYCVLSDSGSITEEASVLSFPAITLRDSHERPEGMDEGTLIVCDLDIDKILDAIHVAVSQINSGETFKIVPDYDTCNVSKKVAKIILSYTSYINREVWKK